MAGAGGAQRDDQDRLALHSLRSLRSGHTWHAPYRNLQQGHGCPRCNRREGRRRKDKRQVEASNPPE